jgi:hypothetical protein
VPLSIFFLPAHRKHRAVFVATGHVPKEIALFPRHTFLKQPFQVGAAFLALCMSIPALYAQKVTTRLLPDTIDESKLTTLTGNVPLKARAQYDQGAVQSALPMNRMVLVLKRSATQEKALQAAIQAMHNPHSSQYHHWLTPDQFGKQYGLSDADLAKVVSWLQSKGFQVDRVAHGRGTIEFSGSADSVANTFHTQIHSYLVNGKKHYANSTAPSIPTALTPAVAGVLSLHNFEKQVPVRILGTLSPKNLQLSTGTPKLKSQLVYKPNFTSGDGNHYVGPGDLWTIYNATPLIVASTPIDGTGQTIAIVGRSDIDLNDFTGFRTNMLPAPYSSTVPFTQIIDGPDPGINDDAIEQTLDTEYSTAMAPGAQITLVVAGSTNTTDGVDLAASYIVDNNLAPVMSTSYGNCEALLGTGNDFYNSLWEQAAAQGITALVSSGDNGAAGCDNVGPSGEDSLAYVADEGLQVSGIASTPYNVAVGGNQFSDDTSTYWDDSSSSSPAPFTSALSYVPETVWNESCSPLACGNAEATISAGSGGASGCFDPKWDSTGSYILSCSGGYSAPDWQVGVYGLSGDKKRHLPDVSLTAAGHDGYMICYDSSCDYSEIKIVGGTSASSPAMAGVLALVNQKTGARQGQANYTLYKLAATEYGSESKQSSSGLSSCNATNGNSVDSSCIFRDVTTGTNAVPCDGGTFNCSSTTTGVYGVLTDFAAGAGYDSATGLGSVNIANLVNHWNDVTSEATSTTLSLGAATSTFGSPVSISVAVKPQSGTGTPTGKVALITDSTQISTQSGGAVTLTNGAYDGTISSLPGGAYNVSGRYAGDTSYNSSTSNSVAIHVNPAASAAQLTIVGYNTITGAAVSGSILPYGSQAKASVALTGVSGQVNPNGSVTLLSSGNTLSTIAVSADGTGYYTSSGLSTGSYSWTAAYAGNNNYQATTSSPAPFTVGQAPTTLKLLATTSYVVGSGTVTFTAIVDTTSLLLNPTGPVTLSANGKTVATSALAAYTDPSTGASAAKATFTVDNSVLTAGSNTFTASYGGDTNYTGASTTAATSIGYSATTPVNVISLTVLPATATIRQPVVLTASVTTGGIAANAGTVEFFDGATSLGTAQVAGSAAAAGCTPGTATLRLLPAPGTHAFRAVYKGVLAAPTKVTSSPVSATITGSLSSKVLVSAAANATNTANYDLTASVMGFGSLAPSGTVDLSELTVVSDLGTVDVATDSASQTLLSPVYYSANDPTDATPAHTVVTDFNGDGIPDLATANASFSNGTVSVLLGKGDGAFGAATTYSVGIFATTLIAGDFNNDGVLDIAVANENASTDESDGSVTILLGNGDGTFQKGINTAISGSPASLAVADFNRDGVLDIATLQYDPATISVAFGNGDGTFQPATIIPLNASSSSPYQIIAADVNGDGASDLLETNSTDNSVLVFLNSGDGTMSLASTISTGNPEAIAVADLNGDGKLDLVAANYGYQTVSVALGNGDGTFQTPVAYNLDGLAASVAVTDMDADGKPDVVVGYFYPNIGVGVLKGNGDGTLSAVTDYATGQGHGYGVTLADLNGDGTPDLISTDINSNDSTLQNIAVLLNATKATAVFKNVAVAGPASQTEQIHGVYSGDGHYLASSSAGIYVNGSGVQTKPQILWTPASPWGANVALGVNVLNAKIDGNIAGAFTYTAQLPDGSVAVVTTASTLTAGTYTITAAFVPVDTTNYAATSTTRTVIVQAADFAITTNTAALTITAGGTSTATVTLPVLYGFTGTVTLSGGSLPGGFTITASPATITAGGSSTITIHTTGLGNGTTASTSPAVSLGQTGLLAVCLLIAPFAWRRRKIFVPMVVIALVTVSSMIGCGGTGFANSAVTLTTVSNKVASGSTVVLTATVSSNNSHPSGTVTFYNGATSLGAATVSDGTASLSLTSLPVGLNSLTAVYSGDSHNSAATASAVSELITGQTSVEIVGTSGSVAHSIVLPVTLQ